MLERQARPVHAGPGAVLGEEFGLDSQRIGQPGEGFQQGSDRIILMVTIGKDGFAI